MRPENIFASWYVKALRTADSQDDDWKLVRLSRQGDKNAFRTLVTRYQKKAFAQALGMLKDKDDAMDVAQEALIKVYKYLDHFKGDASFSTWLYRIVANLCVDHQRRAPNVAANRVELNEQQEHEELEQAGVLSTQLGVDPLKNVLRRELMGKVDDALAQVPPKHREILLLRELEGMSYDDLSRVLKVPKGTVMSRLFHARTRLQRSLTAYLGQEEAGADENSAVSDGKGSSHG